MAIGCLVLRTGLSLFRPNKEEKDESFELVG